MKEIVAVISGILALTATPPYIFDILKNKTRPQRATWIIFTVLSTVAFLSQLKLGATWSLIFLALDALASIVVLLLAIPYGVGGFSLNDKTALVVAGIGLVISIYAHRPLIALIGVVLADLSGFILTLMKTWRHPESETAISWLLFGLASLLAAVSVGELNYALLLYPIYVATVCFSVPLVQIIRTKS